MMRQIVGWGLAFAVTAGVAALLLVSACRGPESAPAAPPSGRDAAKVSDVELELILNKIREGDLQAMREDLPAARRAWQEARRLGEGLWPVHEGLGDSYVRAKLFDEALREYAAAEPLVPDKFAPLRGTILFKRAETLAAAGRPLEAVRAYLELNEPSLGGKLLDLALKADPGQAVEVVRQRAEIHDPRVYIILSALLSKLDRKAEAAEALAKYCVEVAPWDENLNQRAIQGLQAAGKRAAAIDVCRAWVRSSPQALHAYAVMGDLHLESGDEKAAYVAYTSIADVRPGDAAAHLLLADRLRRLKRLDEAIAQVEAARKARPEDQGPYTALVELYEAKGDSARAEEVLLEATKRFGLTGDLRSRVVKTSLERLERLKAAGNLEEARALRGRLADLNVAEAGLFDIKIVMTWDAVSDVDMDVHEPGGEHVHHGHPHSKPGGHYYVDNTKAYGPETYTLKAAPGGVYRVGAHLHGDIRSAVKFVVILFEDTPREERREESFVLEKGGDTRFIRDIVIPR